MTILMTRRDMIDRVAKAIAEEDKEFRINELNCLVSRRKDFYDFINNDDFVRLLAWRVEAHSDVRRTVRLADQSLFDESVYADGNQYFVIAELGVPLGMVETLTDDMVLLVIGPHSDLVIDAKRAIGTMPELPDELERRDVQAEEQPAVPQADGFDWVRDHEQRIEAQKVAKQFMHRLLAELERRFMTRLHEAAAPEVIALLMRDNADADLELVATVCIKMDIEFDDLVHAVLHK